MPVQRQGRVEVRVVAQEAAPAGLEIGDLAGVALFLRTPEFACRGLVMHEDCGGLQERRPASLGEAQAEVDVGKFDRQIDGVEPAIARIPAVLIMRAPS